MFRSHLKHFVAAAVTVLSMASVAMRADTIVFSENFNATTANTGVTIAGAFSAINGTNVDVVGAANGWAFLCAAPESGNCVDLGGTGGNAYGQLDLTKPLTLAAGIYDLSFDLIGSGRGETTSTTVEFGNYSHTFVLTGSDILSGVVINQAVTITGGATQLEFINNGISDPNIGALLDNIEITHPTVTPEPSTLLLLATGVAGLTVIMRRRLMA